MKYTIKMFKNKAHNYEIKINDMHIVSYGNYGDAITAIYAIRNALMAIGYNEVNLVI